MVTNKKPSGRAMSLPGGLAAGVVVSLAIMIIGISVLATLINKEMLEWDSVGYGVMLLLILSSVIGSVLACRKVKRQILLVGVLSGLLFYAVLIGITALFFGGQFEAIGVTALLIIGGSLAAAMMEVRGGERKPYGNNRRVHR